MAEVFMADTPPLTLPHVDPSAVARDTAGNNVAAGGGVGGGTGGLTQEQLATLAREAE